MSTAQKVSFKFRSDLMQRPQADTVVVERYREFLQSQGFEIVEDEKLADIIHFFGMRALQEATSLPSKPYFISPLLDIDEATQQHANYVGATLQEYVSQGQKTPSFTLKAFQAGTHNISQFVQLLKGAKAVLVQSESEQRLVEACTGTNATFMHTPIGLPPYAPGTPELFQSTYKVKDFILCIARLEPRKNQLMLLKAFEQSSLPIVLIDGGIGLDKNYEQAVRCFKRKGQTIVTGGVNQAMIASAIAAAKVHVLPSFYEIPGAVSLEALRQGCPTVATRHGTAADYLKSEALYCNPCDEDSIYTATLAAFYGPRPASKTDVCTWSEVAQKVVALYSSLNESPVIKKTNVILDVVESEIERADGFAGEGNLDEALRVVRKLEQSNPADARAQRALGAILLAQGSIAEAKARFILSEKLNPVDGKTLRGLAMCAQAEERFNDAYEWLVKAVQASPHDTVGMLQLLKASYQLKRFEAIEKALRQHCEAAPSEVSNELKFSYAGVLFEQKKFEEARVVCNTILRADPESKDARQLLARLEPQAESLVPAAGLATKITRARFDATPTPEALIAQLEEFRRNLDLAGLHEGLIKAQTAEKTLSKEQKQRVMLLAADYQVLSGNLDEGKKIYQEISRDDPMNTRSLCGLGALAASEQKWLEAQKFFSQAVALDPRQDVAYAGLGLCSKQENQLERAWGFYKTALSINPENLRALLGMMEVGYPLKRYDEVERALRNYLEFHPADTEFTYALAGCLYAQERLDDASAVLGDVLTFKPEDARAHELQNAIVQKRSASMTQRP